MKDLRFSRKASHKNGLFLLILVLAVDAFVFTPTIPIVSGGLYWRYDAGGSVVIVGVSGDGNYVVAGTQFTGTVYFLGSNGSLIWSYEEPVSGRDVECIGISENGSRIVVGLDEYYSGKPDVYLLDNTGDVVWQKDLFSSGIARDLAISPDAKYIVAGDTDDKVSFFDISGNLLWNYTAGDWVTAVATSADGEYTAAGSWDKSLYLFNKTGGLLWSRSFNYSVKAVSISPEGEYVAAASEVSRNLLLFDKKGTVLLDTTFGNSIEAISISLNAERIAVGAYSRNVTVIDKTGSVLCECKTDEYVNDVAITADGRFFVFGSGDYVTYMEVLPPSETKCDVSPDVSFLGDPVAVNGWINPPVAEAQVLMKYILYFQNSTYDFDGFTRETRTVLTVSNGSFTDTFFPNDTGKWKLVASWSGGAQHAPSEAESFFVVNSAAEINLTSVTPSVFYWRRDEWYCEERFPSSPPELHSHFLMNTETPTSDNSSTVAFSPDRFIWWGHPEWGYWGAHTARLSENTQVESGMWILSTWASARDDNQHFIVELGYWDRNHTFHYLGSRDSGSFNITDPDVPVEFTFNFGMSATILPKGSCLGFVINAGPDTDVKWFFDSNEHPSRLEIPPSAAFVDNVPPEIGNPTQVPAQNVQPGQNVTVRVTVTDSGLGVFNVTLWCNVNSETLWTPLAMKNVYGDTYQAVIGGYENYSNVRYRITAYDFAGNPAVRDNQGQSYSYQVVPEFSTLICMFLLLTSTVALLVKRYANPEKTHPRTRH